MLIITQRMSEPMVEWVGSSCGKHGPYTFYKGFKLTANGETRKYVLGEFYFIRNSKDRPICIAEFQLIWHDANSDSTLASARLYFRPESIPGGRQSCHGKDELLYTDEKVVIKCQDMMKLEYDGTGWSYGIKALSEVYLQEVPTLRSIESEETKKFKLLKRKSKAYKPMPKERPKMIILSFSAYCRFKSLVKKLSSGLVLTKMAIKAFGGVIQCDDSTWVSFSRESFHYPGLAKFDMFTNNKAPVLKGRPRKRRASKTAAAKQNKVKPTIVEQEPRNEAETSDDNQTDTSEETSSLGGQELPCPPKLVSNVQEEPAMEISSSVIRSVKLEVDSKHMAIPPIPKLVKIETLKCHPNGQFRESTKQDESLVYTQKYSSLSTSDSSSSQCENFSQVKDSVSYTTQSRIMTIQKVVNCRTDVSTSNHASVPSNGHASRCSSSHASGSTDSLTSLPSGMPASNNTNHKIIPSKISTIVSTSLATQGEVTKNVDTSERSGNEPEQPLKRKRGRPPGKSNKNLKKPEMKIAPKKLLREIDGDEKQIKADGIGEKMEPGDLGENDDYSPEPQDAEEREFMKNLKIFMRQHGAPIEKIPALGFRKINLFKMYQVTRALGGYDQVTNKRLWRRVYSEVGGAPSITSAATNSRKHYEKLLLPYERYLRGEVYSVEEVTIPESPSPEPDSHVSPQRDQNANEVPRKDTGVLSTNRHKLPKSASSYATNLQSKASVPVSHFVCKKESRLQPAPSDVVSRQNELFESRISHGVSHQNNTYDPPVTRVLSSTLHDRQTKPAITRVMSQQDKRTNSSVSYITSSMPRGEPIMTGVLPMNQQDKTLREYANEQKLYDERVNANYQTPQSRASHPVVEQTHHRTPSKSNYQSQQNRSLAVEQTPSTNPVISNVRTLHGLVVRDGGQSAQGSTSHSLVEQTQYTKPKATYQSQQNRKSVVSHSNAVYNQQVDGDLVERVTTGDRGSPVTLYSSNGDKYCARYSTNIPMDPAHHVARHGAIAGSNESATEDDFTKPYITKVPDGHPGLYVPQNKSDGRLSEFKQKCVTHHNRPRDHRVSEESRDARKRRTEDEMLTNVVPSKMPRIPSPHDEGFIMSVPVFQSSHYPHAHGGFEFYDLPGATFPVRASSRIFMPPHQVFPGASHPAFSPYAPHIIANIGTEPGTLYQLPIPGYSQELGYPYDAGVQILHS